MHRSIVRLKIVELNATTDEPGRKLDGDELRESSERCAIVRAMRNERKGKHGKTKINKK